MGPLGIDTMRDLQNNTVKAESRLREKYQQKLQMEMTIWLLSCAQFMRNNI